MIFNKYLTGKTAKKVPEVIALFWISKLLTTAMGESTSDFLVHHIDSIIAVLLGAIGFMIAIILQFLVRKYIPWIYWLTVTMVAIFGTMAADVVHIVLGVPYFVSTVFFAIALTVIFFIWYRTEKTLSIHSIFTPRREVFYWAVVITTFALGTAAGDMTAITLNLEYLTSGVLFAVLFAAYKLFRANEVFIFWTAYIVTRPFGASFADWFGRTPDTGGIGFGTGQTSSVLTLLIIFFVGDLTITHKDIKKGQA